jgi:hypothetical protein
VKRGAAYEQFIYEKLRRLFPDAKVTVNDKIRGHDSDLDREIDVSIRLKSGDADLLYVVQCKDWVTKADIKVLGEFSAVMQDVRATKGLLLCSAGFCSSNRMYARARSIELLTIRDIKSPKWSVTIQIPLVYIRHQHEYELDMSMVVNQQLVDLNRDRELPIDPSTFRLRVGDGGLEETSDQFVSRLIPDPVAQTGKAVDLTQPGLQIRFAGVWADCSNASVVIHSRTRRYLKQLTPAEYSQIQDHVNEMTMPLHVKLDLSLEDDLVEMAPDVSSNFSGLNIEVEEWSGAFKVN